MRPSSILALFGAISAVAACLPDPVHDRAVEALGDESSQGASAFHRAGQPCTTCHQPAGPADTDFSVAGTVFESPGALVGVDGASVTLVDALGTSPPPVVTNCVGNFWIPRSAWNPTFPVEARVTKGDAAKPMVSTIGRAGSCATCHRTRPADPFASVGAVFLYDAPDPSRRSKTCPVDPEVRP